MKRRKHAVIEGVPGKMLSVASGSLDELLERHRGDIVAICSTRGEAYLEMQIKSTLMMERKSDKPIVVDEEGNFRIEYSLGGSIFTKEFITAYKSLFPQHTYNPCEEVEARKHPRRYK